MRSNNEITSELGLDERDCWYYMDNATWDAMKQAQLEILDELERRFDTNNTGKDIWDFIYELKEELK